jgi:hypothetical protein
MTSTPNEGTNVFSINTTAGVKVTTGPDGKPFTTEKAAQASADDRNQRAEAMGLKVRYEVVPADEAA